MHLAPFARPDNYIDARACIIVVDVSSNMALTQQTMFKLVLGRTGHAKLIDLPTDAIFPVYHRAADQRPNFTEHVEPTTHFSGSSFSSFSE